MASWTFDGLVAHRAISVSLESERRWTTPCMSSWQLTSMFSESGWRTAAAFWPAKIEESPARVAVLGYQLWRNRFGEAIVGSQIRIDGIPHVGGWHHASGVLGTRGHSEPWLPIASLPSLRPNDPYLASLLDRWQDCCECHRTSERTRAEARAELQVLSQRFRGSVGQDRETS